MECFPVNLNITQGAHGSKGEQRARENRLSKLIFCILCGKSHVFNYFASCKNKPSKKQIANISHPHIINIFVELLTLYTYCLVKLR